MNRTLALLARITGSEDLDTVTPDLPKTPEEQIIMESEIETETFKTEALKVEQEITQLEDSQTELTEVTEDLAETVDGIEMLLRATKLDQQSIALLYKKANKLNQRLTGQSVGNVDGNESFTDETFRGYVVDGVEGFTDTLKRAGLAVVDFIKRVYYVLYEFVMSFFDQTQSVRKMSAAVYNELKAGKEFKEVISLGGWNRFFEGGKLDGTDKFFEELAKFAEAVGGLIDEMKNPDKELPQINALTKKIGDTLVSFKKSVTSASGTNGVSMQSVVPFMPVKKYDQSGGVFFHMNLPEKTPEKTEDLVDVLKKVKVSYMSSNDVQVNSEHISKLTGNKPALLTPSEAIKITRTVNNEVQNLTKVKESVTKRKSSIDEIVKRLPTLGEKEADAAKEQKLFVEVIKQTVSFYSNLVKHYSHAQVAVSQAKLKCIRAHYK